MITLIWENIDGCHKRTKVPGGWLVKAYEDVMQDRTVYGHGFQAGYDYRIAMCFVPDTSNDWK